MAIEPQIIPESAWHDPQAVAEFMQRRRRRLAKKWRIETETFVDEQQANDERDTRKWDRNHPKPKGFPELAAPKVLRDGQVSRCITGRVSMQRSELAAGMDGAGLKSKANRSLCCGIFARRLDCVEHDEHRFYDLFRCSLRYCPDGCGERAFTELFAKHSRLAQVVDRVLERARAAHGTGVIAKLDFTTVNRGEMPSPQMVRRFNENIRAFFRLLEKEFGISRKRGAEHYGAIWCDEFGSGNTNLHAHGLYFGPWVAQKKLVKLWRRARNDGSFIISIKVAGSFELALAHALKYPSKFFEAAGARLASLEVAFHKVRRVHAVSAAYNPKLEREPGDDGAMDGGCPYCKAPLGLNFSSAKGWAFADALAREGREDLESVRQRLRISLMDCPFADPAPEAGSP